MGDAPDFITSFHNLDGDAVGERKKNFYRLIKNQALLLNEQQLNDALTKLEPKNYLEGVFFLDALIYFKKTEKLLEILKSGNPVFATNIIKQQWFVEEAFKNFTADKLADEIFPYLSYIVRKKIVKRLSRCWTQEKMDSLYDILESRYGLTHSVNILHKCSISKISSVLEDDEIKLNTNQVIQLFNKSEAAFIDYLNHYKILTNSTYDEMKTLNYVALKNPKLLIDLEKAEKVKLCKIGKRTTKKIMNVLKDDISNDPKRYAQFLKNDVLVRKFSPGFNMIYKKVFPQKFSNMGTDALYLINHYPIKKRWDLFFKTCKEKFPNKSETDILSVLDDICPLNPPERILYKWAEFFYEKKNDDKYLKYFQISNAINILKEKMNGTSETNKRINLGRLMLETCLRNKDLCNLEEVLKYISIRHKNEGQFFRDEILSFLKSNFKLEEFNEVHWKYINEQLEILRIMKHRFYWHSELVYRYLEFLFKNGKDHSSAMNRFVDDLVDNNSYNPLDFKNPEIQKYIFTEACNIFPNIFKEGAEDYQYKINYFISKTITFCIDNKEHVIELLKYPYITSHIQQTFQKNEDKDTTDMELIANVIRYNQKFPDYAIPIDDSIAVKKVSGVITHIQSLWWFSKVISECITIKNRSALGNKILIMYMETFLGEVNGSDILPWVLKNEPRLLLPYVEKLLQKSLQVVGTRIDLDMRLIKQYSHLELDKKTREYFLQQLDTVDKKHSEVIVTIVKGLAHLLNTDEFKNIIDERFLPKQDKLDLEDEEMREIYKIQCDIAKILAKVSEPFKMLPTIMKFARGDYLQSSLPAVYGAFYNSPQRILYSYIEQLSNQAVSVRKHAIFLSCAVMDKPHTIKLLKTTTQSNVSSQKHLFAATLKYFLKNPSRDLLDKVIDSMSTIDKQDSETLESLKNLKIPQKFMPYYSEKAWKFFEEFAANGGVIDGQHEQLLRFISSEKCTLLTNEFVDYIINKYFSDQTKSRICNINTFILHILKHRKSDRTENFEKVIGILSTLDKKYRQEFFNNSISFFYCEKVDREFINLFEELWKKKFSVVQSLKEYISLKLYILSLEYEQDLDNYVKNVLIYLDELISELGFLVFPLFKDQLLSALSRETLKKKLEFILTVLKSRPQDPNSCVLAIQVMDPDIDDEDPEYSELYNNILDILKNINIPIVNVYYKSYLTKTKK